jgi:hypothetical protein
MFLRGANELLHYLQPCCHHVQLRGEWAFCVTTFWRLRTCGSVTRVENEIRYPCGREQSKHRQKKAEIPELKRKGRNGAKEYMEHEWKRRKQCASVGCLPLAQCQCLTVTHTWTATLLRVLTGRSSIRVRVPNSESLHYQPVSVSVQEEERERRKFKTAMELM